MTQLVELTLRSQADVAEITAAVHSALYGESAVRRVRVTLEATDLSGLSLQLGSPMAPRQLDLEVRGAPGGTVLRDSRVGLHGATVLVSGLVFVGSPAAGDTLALGGAEITAKELGFLDQRARHSPRTPRRGSKARGSSLRLTAATPHARATVDDAVFADSDRPTQLSIDGQPNARFDRVSLRAVRIDACPSPAVQPSATLELVLDDLRGPADLLAPTTPALLVDGEPEPVDPGDPALARVRAQR